MDSRMFWFFVTCYLTCILCRNAFGESTTKDNFGMINDFFQPDTTVFKKLRDTEIVESIETRKRLGDSNLKDDWFKTSQISSNVKNLPIKTEISNISRKINCSRYCIRQLRTDKDDSVEDINLFWSFSKSLNKRDNFLLENNPRLNISKCMSVNNKILTNLNNNCHIYLNFDCDPISREGDLINPSKFDSNSKFNYEDVKIPQITPLWSALSEFSKTLVRKTDMSGFTETKFHIDTNVTRIIINIWGNLTRAILAIPTNRTIQTPGMTMSLARTHNMKGVAIGARNIPPGGWCVKLLGVENSKYNLGIVAYYGANEGNNKKNEIVNVKAKIGKEAFIMKNVNWTLDIEHIISTQNKEKTYDRQENNKFNELSKNIHKDSANNRNDSKILPINIEINEKPKIIVERSVEVKIVEPKNIKGQIIIDDIYDTSSLSQSLPIIDDSIKHNSSIIKHFEVHNASNNNATFDEKMLALIKQQQQKIQVRSSEIASLNEDIDTNVKSFAIQNKSMQMMNNDINQALSVQSLDNNREDFLERREILVEVNANSNLVAAPGTIHRVVFDVTNNCVLAVRYQTRVRSSSFRIYSIQPQFIWLYPGQTNYVTVYIIVPRETIQDTINTLTLYIEGTQITEKTVYIYVQDAFSKIIDNVRPTIQYSFNNNCAGKLNKDRCGKTFWSADITVQDADSGLKRVTSTPNTIYQRTPFISGTKQAITFYYSSTCCTTTTKITAIDLLNNQYSRTIDVTEWDNLSEGEIAAITVGALLLLLLLILIIVAIVYCFCRRSSHDLPYTQRYGSRPPARSERTSF